MRGKNLSVIFIVTVLALSILFTVGGVLANNDIILALQQVTPLLATIILIVLFPKDKLYKLIGIKKIGKIRYYLLALLMPTLVLFISYFIGWELGFFKFGGQTENATFDFITIMKFIKILAINDSIYLLNFPIVCIWAIGEEIGWRGFLQPQLIKNLGIKKGIIVTGIVWAVWHYPLIFGANYYENGNTLFNTILFSVTVVGMAIFIGYLTYKTESVWPAVIFHTKSNLTWQICSGMFISSNPNSIYISGEAGIVNVILWGIIAFVIFKKLIVNSTCHKLEVSSAEK
ncbi:CPBP family intramembrane metalloprotease [Clostridium sp. SHJSY1]|uniref:type II CAAX endopeptidase family protein n=1 Tax=Clostridium sp. SHJSY1 TaxID=2942483 RepID=UPI0028751499|nr:type II CAAX endopeptidase family protein [Clostridium sp. SHJSY1]MDS0528077.1 CPBP family intramembrane metalloprotease [Clostridium sp. SHJSY1]